MKIFIFVLLITCGLYEFELVHAQTTAGNEFYFGFPINYNGLITKLQLFVYTTHPQAEFNITAFDDNFSFSGTCSPFNPAIVDIPFSYQINSLADRRKGLKLSAKQTVSVFGLNFEQFTLAKSLFYPCNPINNPNEPLDYYVVSAAPFPGMKSNFLIVPCYDDSDITIVPSQNISIPMDPLVSNSPIKTLNTEESHRIRLHSMQTLLISSVLDLTSSKITSNKPLTVISGTECSDIPADIPWCDFLMTQVPPTIQWGRRFLLSPHKGRAGQGYKIVAHVDTLVITKCNNSASVNYMLSTTNPSVTFYTLGSTFCSVLSNEPIYMVQLGVGAAYENDGFGDPAISNIPPVEQHVNSVQFTDVSELDENYYTVVVQNDQYFNRKLLIDGTLQDISSWRTIDNSDGSIAGYGYSSEIFSGTHRIAHPNANGKLHVTVYGWSSYGGYSYAAGSAVLPLNTFKEVNIKPTHGNMLGGTAMVIENLSQSQISSVSCVFDSITVKGAYIASDHKALCVSPRLPRPGPVTLKVIINDAEEVSTNDNIFYAHHYSDLVDVNSDVGSELVIDYSMEKSINLEWNDQLLLHSLAGDPFLQKVDIYLHEARLHDNKIQWIGRKRRVASGVNDGFITVSLPAMLGGQQETTPMTGASSYSIILFMVSLASCDSVGPIGPHPYCSSLVQLINQQNSDAFPAAGKWSHIFFRQLVTKSNRALCDSWVSTSAYHPTSNDGVEPCPCTRRQADLPMSIFTPRDTPGKQKLDSFFHGQNIICYQPKRISPNSRDGIFRLSQECCFNSISGDLITGSNSRTGSMNAQPPNDWENHFVYDMDPFISCCKQSNGVQSYYEKRPFDNCTNFQPFDPPARAGGDPHILTLDGYQYTFNGKGEFILIDSDDGLFQMQGRMVSLPRDDNEQDSMGTVFSAIAAKQSDSDTIKVKAGSERPILFVNKIQIDLEDDLLEAYNNCTVRIRRGTYLITFSSGAYLEVNQSNGFLSSLVVSLPRSFYNSTKGLMGVYNGDPNDDLLPFNGSSPLSLNSSIEEIHSQFGLTWIVSDRNQSLFVYDTQDTFESFYQPEFSPVFRPSFDDPNLEREAAEICQGDSMCLFDIAATGRTEIGMDTLQQQQEIEEIIELVNTPVVCSLPCLNGVCIANDTCNCYVGYTGAQCDKEDVCTYDYSSAPCAETVEGWFYNTDTRTCEFGACKGRGNTFTTMRECVKNCGGCNDSANVEHCLVHPCSFSKCPAYPQAKCEADACDLCTPRFMIGATEVTNDCDIMCGNGSSHIKPTDCLIQPCDVSYCPNYPNAVCLPDYCGGCNARFYTEFGVDITDQCTDCPANKPELKCPYDPCDYKQCVNVPEATCMFDTCGQCKARFFINDGETEVTETCQTCSTEGQVFMSCALPKSCQKTCANYRQSIDCSNTELCKPGCACPDNMVLDEVNNRCVSPEDCPCAVCDPVPNNCSTVTIPSGNCSCPVCTDCPDGQSFQECMRCPGTCAEDSSSNTVCSDHCVPGCQCSNANELYDEITGQCVLKKDCQEPDRCTLPAFTGPCKGNIRRYYYNKESQRCEAFKYGGCMGNKNNFFTLHDCETACSSLPPSCSPSFCVKERDSMCTVRYDVTPGSTGCPFRYTVSNCRVCYYSTTALSEPQGLPCTGGYCVSSNGGYDDQCLKNWGVCVKNSLISIIRSVPLGERIPENYKCIEYTCPSPST